MPGASDLGGGATAEGEAETAAVAVAVVDSGGGGGNRWPHEETMALLKIRCEMNSAFRDASLKAPLWEEVSRKLGEVGFDRTAKKCKEKFENVYKYHRRTKEGRSGLHKHAKTYRFFDQLEALDSINANRTTPPQPQPQPQPQPLLQLPSPEKTTAMASPQPPMVEPINAYQGMAAAPARSAAEFTFTTTTSSSSEGEAESETQTQARKRKKRKLSGFFEKLMKEVMERQEALQRQFIEAIERCESERRAREEAWKAQELAKIKREQELLAQERAVAAAKDAAVIACLRKLSEKAAANSSPEKSEAHPHQITPDNDNTATATNNNNNRVSSSSRWPKPEVEALIKIRTDLDLNQHHHHPIHHLQISESGGGGGGAKGPLWEEVSTTMKKMGYDRSAKRCKEKWENINKYFRRVKDGKRKRPQDSKTCPYFHQLDVIYRNRSVPDDPMTPIHGSAAFEFKPEELLMQMVEEGHGHGNGHRMGTDGDTAGDDDDEDDDDDGDDDEGEVEGGDAYQVVANNTSSTAASMAMMD